MLISTYHTTILVLCFYSYCSLRIFLNNRFTFSSKRYSCSLQKPYETNRPTPIPATVYLRGLRLAGRATMPYMSAATVKRPVMTMEPSLDCFLYLRVSSLRTAISFWSRYILLASINFSFTLVLPYSFCSSPRKEFWKVKLPNYSASARQRGPSRSKLKPLRVVGASAMRIYNYGESSSQRKSRKSSELVSQPRTFSSKCRISRGEGALRRILAGIRQRRLVCLVRRISCRPRSKGYMFQASLNRRGWLYCTRENSRLTGVQICLRRESMRKRCSSTFLLGLDFPWRETDCICLSTLNCLRVWEGGSSLSGSVISGSSMMQLCERCGPSGRGAFSELCFCLRLVLGALMGVFFGKKCWRIMFQYQIYHFQCHIICGSLQLLCMFDESSKLCDVRYKIVFLGQSAVGKSAVIERFIQERFDPAKAETVGIDFMVKNIHYQGSVYRLQLWDTAGQEKFKSLVPNYIRDAHCAVFVYDITRRDSFEGVDSWLELYKNYHAEDAVTILVGNKLDLRDTRKVTREEGQTKARAKGLSFCETSAKSGAGIEELFHSIIENIRVSKERPKEDEKEGNKTSTTQEVSINKTKIVKIGQQKKQFPCCYI